LAINPPDGIGFERSPDEEKIWEHIRGLIHSECELTTKDKAGNLQLAQHLLQIENGFAFGLEQPEDDDFRALHIEPLLDQAADLLDRGMRDRAEWDDKGVKALNLCLELHEYADLDQVHAMEEKAGYYEVPYKQSIAEVSAENLNSSLNGWTHDYVLNTINNYYSPTEINKQYNWARRQAWITGLVAYLFETPNFKQYVTHTYGSDAKTVALHAVAAAEGLSLHNLYTQSRALGLQMEVFDNSMQISDKRIPGLAAKASWERADIAFKKMRTAIARKYQDLKVRAATEPDGILNYLKRMTTLKQRFNADFRSALARLKQVQLGLDGVYGYTSQFPTDEKSITYFDDCQKWVRDAINWLVRFSRSEQNYVLPVSLRNIGDQIWKDGLKAGTWDVNVTKEMFPDQLHVRLRGISATVDEDDGESLWPVTVLAPRQGTFYHLSGRVVRVDQSNLPPCRLGRVSTRDTFKEPDIVGVSSLHNASPIGGWKVVVDARSAEGAERKKLRDIVLYLHLAVRAPRIKQDKFIIAP
jgi:hypothetical protein